jgi:hypothetical protein
MFRAGALTLCAMLGSIAPGYAKPPLGQVYSQPGPVQRGDFRDPYYGRQNGQICPRWCMEDRQPCDPPHFKIADGRCAPENFLPPF